MAYVYRHIRLDKNEPFYIGIGSDSRHKRANEKSRRSELWNKIVAKSKYVVEILIDDIDFEFAKQREIEFIKLYGRKNLGTGPLCNLTDGGDGLINKVFTKEYREKLSVAAKGRIISFEQRQKISESRKKNPTVFTEEGRKKISEANKGREKSAYFIEVMKQRTGQNNPMYGKRNNYMGDVAAYKDGVQVSIYEGIHKAAAALNVTATKISACLNNRRKTTGGYTFKRLDLSDSGVVDVQNKRIKNGKIV